MARTFSAIWLSSIVLAAAFIVLVLEAYDEGAQQYPRGFPPLAGAKIVFIGSSLTRFALPVPESKQGVLGDGRACAMFALPDISQQLSTRLLAHAVDAGAETVFLEINAYAHDYEHASEATPLNDMTRALRRTSNRLVSTVRSLLSGVPKKNYTLACRARKTTRNLDAAQLLPGDFYRINPIEPSHPEALQGSLARARAAGVEVFFFSPPRPESLVENLGNEEYAALVAHLEGIAAKQGAPLWYSPAPWPDDHFMDILAHTNQRGRLRFQQELTRWYEARQ